MTFPELCRGVKTRLAQRHRYAHCLRVARLAASLARSHGINARKARDAGMLHDLARLYPAQRLIDECTARSIPIDDFERRNPILLHAHLGAALARECFHVDDTAVLGAIAQHTVAAPVMSPLACVVYLADALEPGRSFSGRDELLRLAKSNLAAAMAATISASVRYLSERGLDVAPQTLEAARAFGATLPEESNCSI